uniref:Uncharacterized protein n=1 Tax=Amphimedon queenslandica TaxID=400682 RepID=A0A1X7T975_AMPQE
MVTSCRFLDGIIGDSSSKGRFVSMKAKQWESYVRMLTLVAGDHPQEAYIALTKSLQNEWLYLQKVTPNCGHLFQSVEDSLSSVFIPALIGHNASSRDRTLFYLPVRFDGLNIRDPIVNAESLYNTSREATQVLSDSIKGFHEFSLSDHMELILSTRSAFIKAQHDIYAQIFSKIFDSSDLVSKRFLSRNRDSLSAWLTDTPISKDDFHLSAIEFRDALCLRYMKPLLQLPPNCDGCGDVFTTSHALDCRRSGLIIYRHNKIHDLLFSFSSLVWTQTVKQPIVKDSTSSNPPFDSLIADLGARGVWQPQTTTLFDIRIVDTDVPSYLTKSPEAVFKHC